MRRPEEPAAATHGHPRLAQRTHDHTDVALGSDTVGSTQIATGAVDSDEIATGAVDTDELAANAVTEAKLASAVVDALCPIGSILAFGDSTAPSGWLTCDGTAVSRTTYSDLFNVIGTNFGAGDGSTTFNLPSLGASRFPRGTTGTPGGTGGSTSHTHDLDTSTSHAKLQSHDPGLGPVISVARRAISSWTSEQSMGVNSSGSSSHSGLGQGVELAGDSGSTSHLPSYQQVHFIIRSGV